MHLLQEYIHTIIHEAAAPASFLQRARDIMQLHDDDEAGEADGADEADEADEALRSASPEEFASRAKQALTDTLLLSHDLKAAYEVRTTRAIPGELTAVPRLLKAAEVQLEELESAFTDCFSSVNNIKIYLRSKWNICSILRTYIVPAAKLVEKYYQHQ